MNRNRKILGEPHHEKYSHEYLLYTIYLFLFLFFFEGETITVSLVVTILIVLM